MGIEIVLYDRSPVTQKIFFHVLHHYGPIVHMVSRADAFIQKIQFHAPDIIFIDSVFSDDPDLQSQIQKEAEGKLKNIPIILMAHKEVSPHQRESTRAKDILKKPISAGHLRELINNFIPKTRQNILNKHLKFPPTPDFKEAEGSLSQEDTVLENQTLQEKTIRISQGLDPSPSASSEGEIAIRPSLDTEGALSPGPSIQPPSSDLDNADDSHTSIGIEPMSDVSVLKDLSQAPQKSQQAEGFSPLGKKEKPLVETNTGIRPITETPEQEDIRTDVEDIPKAPLMASSTLMDTGTGIGPQKGQDGDFKGHEGPAGHKPYVSAKKARGPSPQDRGKADTEAMEEEHHGGPLNPVMENAKLEAKKEVSRFIEQNLPEQAKIRIQQFIDNKGQSIMQQAVEKAVWQVVPELAKQLITQELNRLLKEEEDSHG